MRNASTVKFLTCYTHRDIEERVAKNNKNFEKVVNFMAKNLRPGFTCIEMLQLAAHVSDSLGIYLDRMAKRNRKALICWFSEHWDKIQEYFLINGVRLNYPVEETCSSPNFFEVLNLLNYH